MSSRSEQRKEELARRKHKALRHSYLRAPKGYGRGCLICGRMPDEHEDEPASQEEAGDVGESGGSDAGAGAVAGGGDAGGGGGGGAGV
jgi:hypothetical protein